MANKNHVGQLYKNKVNVVAPKSVDMSEYANGRIPSYLSYQNNNVVNVTDILKNFPLPTWYTQYADQNGNFIAYEEPNQWYNKIYGVTSTWELMFNTESVYFRTEGSKSNLKRVDGIQPYGMKKLTGSVSTGAEYNMALFRDSSGVFSLSGTDSKANLSYGTNTHYYFMNLNTNKQMNEYSDDIVVSNRLIRVYHLLSVNGKPVSEIVAGA